jgi:hypothetical protein
VIPPRSGFLAPNNRDRSCDATVFYIRWGPGFTTPQLINSTFDDPGIRVSVIQ